MAHHDPFFAGSTSDAPAQTRQHYTGRDHDHLNSMRLPDLRALADTLGLEPTGRRDVLIDRIRAHQQRSTS